MFLFFYKYIWKWFLKGMYGHYFSRRAILGIWGGIFVVLVVDLPCYLHGLVCWRSYKKCDIVKQRKYESPSKCYNDDKRILGFGRPMSHSCVVIVITVILFALHYILGSTQELLTSWDMYSFIEIHFPFLSFILELQSRTIKIDFQYLDPVNTLILVSGQYCPHSELSIPSFTIFWESLSKIGIIYSLKVCKNLPVNPRWVFYVVRYFIMKKFL